MEDTFKYEQTVRSNESIRDAMDGKIDEPRITESRENNDSCKCGKNNCSDDNNCCSRG